MDYTSDRCKKKNLLFIYVVCSIQFKLDSKYIQSILFQMHLIEASNEQKIYS